ncbi:MAG: sugar phosphate isomerase/epimerase family protein [Flavitalea sp.]
MAISGVPLLGIPPPITKVETIDNRFKISLNAYSFNSPLRAGSTNLIEVIKFCAAEGFDGVDLTGYYFPGYPEVPGDEYIFRLKRKAHELGIGISGTGIRTDFAETDKMKRTEQVSFVKKWILVAAKLGAPVIRIFTGKSVPEKFSWNEVAEWITEEIKTCVDFGKSHGVIVAMQNHNDFIKTADEAIDLIKRVNNEWFGLVLDTGSFVSKEPYSEIAKAAPYAVNWQIKEKLNYKGKNEDMNLVKLFRIIKSSPYRGYLPIETLSPGDPVNIIPPFLKLVKTALAKSVL